MKINELIKDVHENAVAHGWWEEERPIEEIFALIHSELSEALEEARAGRPNVWYECEYGTNTSCCSNLHGICAYRDTASDVCRHRKEKPEGVCVELIDAAIRMMDFLGKLGYTVDEVIFEGELNYLKGSRNMKSVASEICGLHVGLSYALLNFKNNKDSFKRPVAEFFSLLFFVIISLGEDPETILIEKHEYNKTRPYKHGKLF